MVKLRFYAKNIAKESLVSKNILASFTTEDIPLKRRRSSFELGKMKKLFPKSEFKIIRYFEGTFRDSEHIGMPKPHTHGIVEIIACKK